MEEIKIFLADCWRMFTDVTVPGINISFASLYLGIFVVGVATVILRPLLGIGFGGLSNLTSGAVRAGKRGYDKAYSKSYAKYARDRDRAAEYAKRYKESKK